MSSSKNGEKRTVNQAGKTHFGKWFLYQTSEKEDRWRKNVVNDEQGIIVADSYIMLVRNNINVREGIYTYRLMFAGDARWLKEHYESIYGVELKFDDIQHAKDQVDRFIDKLNNLIAFI